MSTDRMMEAAERMSEAAAQQDRDEALAGRIASILGWAHDGMEARADGRSYIRVEDGVASCYGPVAKTARTRKALAAEGIEVER